MTDGLPSLGDAAGWVANKISSFLHFSKPDQGPLADADQYMPDMIDLLVKGIRDNAGKLDYAVDGLAGRISDTLTDDLNGSINIAANVSGRGGTASGVSMGGVTINVYGAQGQDEMVLAQQIAAIINNQVYRSEAVFA